MRYFKYLIIITLLLITTTGVLAGEYRTANGVFRYSSDYPNYYNLWHRAGSIAAYWLNYVGINILFNRQLTPAQTFWLTFTEGLIYEVYFDGFNNPIPFVKDKHFKAQGVFDWRDIAENTCGAMISYGIHKIINAKYDKVRLSGAYGKLTFAFSL